MKISLRSFHHLFVIVLVNLVLFATFSFFTPASLVVAEACWHTIGEWEEMTDIPVARVEGMSIVADGKIYVVGGFYDNSWHASNRLDIYNPATDTWSQGANYPILISHAGIALDGDDIWVVGGFNDYPVTDNVWIYSIANNEWRAGPDLPDEIGSASLIKVGRNLHYFGGVESDRLTDRDEHLILDLDNPTQWTLHTSINRPRNHMSPVYINGLVYALGGMLGHNGGLELDVNYVDVYNPATNTWSEHGSLNFPRSHFEPGTIVNHGRVIMMGGRNNTAGQTRITNLTEYNPATNESHELRAVPERTIGGVAQIVGDKIIVSAGQTWARDTWRADISFDCATVNPAITIDKSTDQNIAYGAGATFTITVQNTGDVALSDVSVSDPLTPACDRFIGSLTPNAIYTYTCTLNNVIQSFTNTAYVSATGGGISVGHNDSAIVTISPNPLPVQPTGLDITGDLQTPPISPTYYWSHDSNTTWYHLFINGFNGTLLDRWYEVGNTIICDDTCSITPDLGLSMNGEYSWWVRGWNAQGNGAWSDTATFTVAIPAPAIPTGFAVNGELTAPATLSFSWDNDPNSTWYELYISNAGGIQHNQWYQVTPNTCNDVTCTITPNVNFNAGEYSWWVRGWNDVVGNGQWNESAQQFTVNAPLPLQPPSNLTVVGDLNSQPTIPAFQFNRVSGATWVQLWLNGAQGNITQAWFEVEGNSVNCDDVMCTISPELSLPVGNYSWWVRSWNVAQGMGPWNAQGATFTVSNG